MTTDGCDLASAVFLLLLGFAISVLSGFLGIGGGIVMAPVLLYLPPFLGLGVLDMRQVTGLSITQGLLACLSGAARHDKYHYVNRELVAWMGASIALSALAGSLLSRWIANETLMMLFAALAILAAVLMCIPNANDDETTDANSCGFDRPRALLIALVVGLLGGMVGQGGSFILIPLMLYALKLPTRVVIGSSLALVFFCSVAGFVGKLVTGQIPFLPAALLAAGAVPGAQLGSVLSHRTSPRGLRVALAVVVCLAALRIAADVLAHM